MTSLQRGQKWGSIAYHNRSNRRTHNRRYRRSSYKGRSYTAGCCHTLQNRSREGHNQALKQTYNWCYFDKISVPQYFLFLRLCLTSTSEPYLYMRTVESRKLSCKVNKINVRNIKIRHNTLTVSPVIRPWSCIRYKTIWRFEKSSWIAFKRTMTSYSGLYGTSTKFYFYSRTHRPSHGVQLWGVPPWQTHVPSSPHTEWSIELQSLSVEQSRSSTASSSKRLD